MKIMRKFVSARVEHIRGRAEQLGLSVSDYLRGLIKSDLSIASVAEEATISLSCSDNKIYCRPLGPTEVLHMLAMRKVIEELEQRHDSEVNSQIKAALNGLITGCAQEIVRASVRPSMNPTILHGMEINELKDVIGQLLLGTLTKSNLRAAI